MRWADNAELVAIGSRSEARAREKATELGAARAHGTYEALLADPDVDAVYIGLPTGEHAHWALAAAEAGKHVLCDKSLTLDGERALALRAAFQRHGRLLVEGFMVRHHPQWSLAKRLVDHDAIGRVRHVRAWFRATLDNPADHRWSPTLGGGALFDVTCYAVNAARFFVGEEPVAVQGVARWASERVDEATDALLEFPGGAVASVHGSLRAPYEQGLVVSGDRGLLVMRRPFSPGWEPTEIEIHVRREGPEVQLVAGANHFLHMVEHVSGCILDPARPLAPAEDGVANVLACAAIQASCLAESKVTVGAH
ncbi:MAG: afr 6 [Labilithrix sp.]|nr:afr 6 [Labilithrix sp.]